MSYGMKTKAPTGKVMLNAPDRITRMVFVHETEEDEYDSVTIPDAAGRKSFEMVYGLTHTHVVTRSGTTFSWEPSPRAQSNGYTDTKSLIFIFLYT